MNNSLQHIKVDIKCGVNCDHSNCIEYALNLIHRNIISYHSTVYKSIELEFYDCSINQKYSSIDPNFNHSNNLAYSKTSPIYNCNFSSHQNLQEQKDNFTSNGDKYTAHHLSHNHKQIPIHDLNPGFKNFELNRVSNDNITTESVFSLDELSINNLSLESAKAHLVKAIKLLKQTYAPNSADLSSTAYKSANSLVPLDSRPSIPPAQDVLNWLTKEESGKQTRPNLQRSDTSSSLSSYHLANQSPISPTANRETSKRSSSELTPIMMTMPTKYPRRSSREMTSDSSQDSQIVPPPPQHPPMSPSLLRRHAGATKEPKYAITEWDQHLQIIKDQEEAYETVTESPASSPKRVEAEEVIQRDYDSESTTSLENPIAAFEAMANH